jgi:nicotinamide mononucleotide transporter
MLESFIAGLKATSPLEAVSVALGLAYVLLAVKRNRWCWVTGGLSSLILIYLSAKRHLPMQALLDTYYVVMSVYGFIHWTRDHGAVTRVPTFWPLRSHLLAWVVILIVSALSARWLAAETQAAWPFLDSVSTYASLLAAWLEARVKVETWVYWIVLDVIFVFLFYKQGLVFVATLFAVYLVISAFGLRSWLTASRQPVLAT